MQQEPVAGQNRGKRRSLSDLLIWLALIAFILGTLLCCGQLAIFLVSKNLSDNTQSKLSADYQQWPYESIAPIDVERLIRDIEKEQRLYGSGVPEVVSTKEVFWQPPTPVKEVAEVTPTAATGTAAVRTATAAVRTPSPSATFTRPAATITRRPTSTLLPTVTRTPTLPPTTTPTRTYAPLLPTHTFTDEPPRERTQTFTPMPPTLIPTTQVPTTEVPPTSETPPTAEPTITPTYAPVRPIVENGGTAEPVSGGGCRAFFGYRNDNPYEVDIAYGDNNRIDDPVAVANPPQPTHFLIGREFLVFEFSWFTGSPLTWWLDGRPATAEWCNPPP